MCNIDIFFPVLLGYFILLTALTAASKSVTYKGMFYSCTIFLAFFTCYMVSVFNNLTLADASSEFSWSFNTTNWVALEVTLALRFDFLSYLFSLLVLVIGFGTNIYILNYMKYEAQEDSFALLINWFMFSMVLLVLANNLFTLFLGWEAMGLSSFFLINFWSTRSGTMKSSFKAFFFNRMSDVFLFIFLVGVHYLTYNNNLSVLNLKTQLTFLPSSGALQTTAVCLFMCTLFKSAQLFGHLWLPDSMEAPVPASALIHSATLVSAGIYLLIRFTPLVSLNELQTTAAVIGSITAAYGGLVSASQTDMKKLLAYSTISHCGFLFVTMGAEVYSATIIYLFLHGLFKALTFFCAGSFIRVAGSQDTRQMGNMSRLLPVDTIFLIICSFNLGGLPFSLGYLYKSSLMTALLNTNSLPFILGLSTMGLLTGVMYVYSLVYYSAFDTSKEFFSSLIYELQQKQIDVVNYYSLTSIVQIIAITILLVFTGWVYISFVNYFLTSYLMFDRLPFAFEANPLLFVYSNYFFKSFYEMFYVLYVLVAYILAVVVWRIEYTYVFKMNMLLFSLVSTLFLVVYSSVL